MDRFTRICILIVVLALLAWLALFVRDYIDCSRRGGIMVRTPLNYQCAAPR